ncbi:OmpP1/FadL family transporter [Parapedobacter lycopersici]|uniref:OmpP1/FadL family transporter n=1 Tax=Parapedobacter lycopersici TaxID=1864939 RepID=UPI00214DACF8|nr:outer membrane protein transport protein [Parapedobacter lycopersici]
MNISKSIAFLSLLLAGTATGVRAQYIDDIRRYAQPEQGATARFKGLGNAQTALGGDLSSVSGNPAGLGFFGQSDLSITLDYANDVNKANYFGTNSQNSIGRVGISQFAAVFNLPTRRAIGSNLTSGWVNFNIGVGYHKTNNFNTTLGYTGINSESSIADFMTYESGNVFGDFGWEAGMIDEDADEYLIPMTTLDNRQTAFNREEGFQSETNVSFGANYSNRFYIGGSLGFARVNHRVNSLFMEDGSIENAGYIYPQNPSSRFVNTGHADYDIYNPLLESDYAYDNEYWSDTRGNGFNAKLGIIYKPVNQLQIGITATTPTWYTLTNEYTDYFGITNYLSDGTEDGLEYPEETTYFDYNLRTPYRLNGGIAVLFGTGLISADVEYVDYASMRFTSSDTGTDNDMNNDIQNTYKSAVNFRVGGEYMIAPDLMIRAGYGYAGGPFKDFDSNTQTVSAGLGYRINNLYFDLAYQNMSQKYSLNPYVLDDANGHYSPVVDVDNFRNSVFLTAGFKF